MLRLLRRLLPPSAIRLLGRMQFTFPVLGPLIRWAGKRSTAGIQTIQYGRAKGLRIDNQLGFPGYATGTTEPEEQDALWRLLSPGGTFVNVGANIGFHVLIGALRVGSSGRVIAIEPATDAAAAIEKNCSLNELSNVTIVRAACSDRVGTAKFYGGTTSATNSLIMERTEGRHFVVVDTITIDDLARSLSIVPNLILIDIEGAEIGCLRGSLQTLREYRPTILLENHWLQSEFYDLYYTELAPLGYRLEYLSGQPYRTIETRKREHIVARCLGL